MILGEAETADNRSRGPSLTLDDVFRRHARRRPDALALIDQALPAEARIALPMPKPIAS
jgi:hypothetical protein